MTTNQAQSPQKRIEYIDALRGLAMILVVFGHVEMTSFGFGSPAVTDTGSFITAFHLPLFFWLSGFLSYKANIKWNSATLLKISIDKALFLLVPALVLGIIYTYTHLNTDFYSFITHNGKLGYWFTIALFEIFLILYTSNTILYSPNPKTHRKRMLIALIVISGVLFISKIALKINPTLNYIGNIFTFHHSFNYFQYFAFGYICSMYKETFNKIIECKYLAAIIITLFSALFYIKRCHITNFAGDGMSIYRMLDIIFEMIIGYFGLLIVYNTFKTYQGSFTNDKKIGRTLQFIGKRTLDIYLLHYFLLPHLPQIGQMLSDCSNATLELTVGLLISIIIICLCLIISSILRISPFLAKWLFGVKQ